MTLIGAHLDESLVVNFPSIKMVVIGGRTYLISELKGKLNFEGEEACSSEFDKAMACFTANKNRTTPCLALISRFEICMHSEEKNAKKKIGSNFGHKINSIAKQIFRNKIK